MEKWSSGERSQLDVSSYHEETLDKLRTRNLSPYVGQLVSRVPAVQELHWTPWEATILTFIHTSHAFHQRNDGFHSFIHSFCTKSDWKSILKPIFKHVFSSAILLCHRSAGFHSALLLSCYGNTSPYFSWSRHMIWISQTCSFHMIFLGLLAVTGLSKEEGFQLH